MATKRVLNRIRLDKIAAVDKPCQEHAVVAIIKRAPEPGENAPPAIVKATFQEALNAELLDKLVCDTFWEAFENQWAVREAFKTALTDELAAGGDGETAAAGFTAAMQTIATSAAQAARQAASTAVPDLTAAVEDAVSKWLQTQQQENPMKIISKAALASAVASFTLAKSSAAEMAAITDAAVEFGALDALDGQPELLAIATAKAAAQKSEDLAKEVAVLKMAPAIRKHYDGLSADQQAAFIAKSAADQQAEVDALETADPVVHKCLDGTVIRKSDGAAVLATAKRNDALSKEVGELREGNAAGAIEKRAKSDYPNVALSVATDMLKSAAQLGEATDAGKAIIASLNTMNKGASNLFKSLGSSAVPAVGETLQKARQDFDTEVAKVAREDKIGMADAMSKVRADRPDLFEAAYPETAALDADA